MRASAIFSEVWRNIRTGTARSLLLTLVLASLMTVLGVADIVSIASLEEKAETFVDSGAAIRTVSLETRIDPRSCDVLSDAETVRASGAIAATAPVTLAALPHGSIPAYSVTPSFASVLALEPELAAGVWIPENLAEILHASPGATVQTDTGTLQVSGVFEWPDDGRDSRLRYAILVPDVTLDRYDECWAAVWPTSEETDVLLRFAGALGGSTDEPLTLAQVNRNHGSSFDGYEEYLSRITQHAIPVGAVVGFLIAFTSVRLRRLEYAGALHAGQTRAAAAATGLLETVVWCVAAALIASAALLLTARALSSTGELTSAATGIRAAAATSGGALVGAATALTLVRESHLFRYFKDR